MRLVTFLGTGQRLPANYRFADPDFEKVVSTPHISFALAEIFKPAEIFLISTKEALEQHGEAILEALANAGHPGPETKLVPTEGDSENLWRLFESVVDCFEGARHPVLLDITHGFRSQPFFASSCVQFVQSVLPYPPQFRIFYGEYRNPVNHPFSPVWELTTFIDVLEWSRSLMLFMRTGRADDAAVPATRLARELAKAWAAGGKNGPRPELGLLASAMTRFGDDFVSVRTGSLLLGTPKSASSAAQLFEAISRTRNEAARELPPLGRVLEQLQGMVAPLVTGEPLSRPSGQKSLIALARLYQRMGRLGEACSILREGWITLGAPDSASRPGTPAYDKDARDAQENAWIERTPIYRSVSELRNDIQHAGFNQQPHDRQWFERQLSTLISQWEAAVLAASPN